MKNRNKKAIITGVTGQDGSHLADLLLSKNYKVVGIHRRTSNNTHPNISHLSGNSGFVLECADLTDASSIQSVLKKHSDACEFYNLAAQSHVGVSFSQPATTWDITAKGCLNILQSILDLGLKDIRFYQASSSEMFGKNYDESYDEYGGQTYKYQDEDTKFMPQSPYAVAKCAAHYTTQLFREAYGMHCSCGILFNHEGTRRGETFVTRKITKWVASFIKWCGRYGYDPNNISAICSNSDLLFYSGEVPSFSKLRLGNLDSFRDWGYAPDYCEAMWLMTQQPSGDDYVICTGETHSIREFLNTAFGYVGITNWEPYVVQDPKFYRPAEVDYLRGDCSKAKRKLGWKPRCSFEELVTNMIESDLCLCGTMKTRCTKKLENSL